MLTDKSLTERAIEDVKNNISLVDGIRALRKYLRDGGDDYTRLHVSHYAKAYTAEATRIGLIELKLQALNNIQDSLHENVALGFMEEVPGKPGSFRITAAGEEYVRNMMNSR